MERTDWLDGGFDSAESRFLMVTAITHHRFTSGVWGEHEIRKLYAELAEIEASAAGALAAMGTQSPVSGHPSAEVMPRGCSGPRYGRDLSALRAPVHPRSTA
jgi:hypothetical protein